MIKTKPEKIVVKKVKIASIDNILGSFAIKMSRETRQCFWIPWDLKVDADWWGCR